MSDPTMLLSAAVGARIASELEDIPGVHVPVARGRSVGHVIWTQRLGEYVSRAGRPLCRPWSALSGLSLLEDRPARLMPLCRMCAARLTGHGQRLEPNRWERTAWCAAELLTAVALGDVDRREAAIKTAIDAGVTAVRGQWIPDSRQEVPLHSLIALWRNQGELAKWEDGLRAQPQTARYRNGYALTRSGTPR